MLKRLRITSTALSRPHRLISSPLGLLSSVKQMLHSSSPRLTSPIKGVIFDMGGVLLPKPGTYFLQFEKERGLPEGTLLKAVLQDKLHGPWARFERGEIPIHKFEDEFGALCSQLSGQICDIRGLVSNFPSSAQIHPAMLDCVQCLRADGFLTAVLTNNWFTGEVGGPSYMPLPRDLFHSVVESCRVGHRKPQDEIYHHCLNELRLPAEQVVFLDDIGDNVKTARRLGMHTILVRSPEQGLAELALLLKDTYGGTEEERAVGPKGFAAGTRCVAPRLRLPMASLKQYLRQQLNLDTSDLTIRSFTHGQSNPTYFITCQQGKQRLVLRKKPQGKLLPSAHMIEREFAVISAMGKQGVPVPRLLHFCHDTNVLGTPFYVMEYVSGRHFTDFGLASLLPTSRRKVIYRSMAQCLAQIHAVPLDKCGLPMPTSLSSVEYLQRNLSRWVQQYKKSCTSPHESSSDMDSLITWLQSHLPSEKDAGHITLVHGDFRLDNLIFSLTQDHCVEAVLDWELCTFGDPLTDVATSCLPYYLPNYFPNIGGFGDSSPPEGVPSLEEYQRMYCEFSLRDSLHNWDFYVSFVFFRMAAILQGVYKRATQGQASSPKSEALGSFAKEMASRGWSIASRSRLSPTGSSTHIRQLHTSSSASVECLPVMVSQLRPQVQELHKKVDDFVRQEIIPREPIMVAHLLSENRWHICPTMEMLKEKARAAGLWNLFIPKDIDPEGHGAGLTNVEYAFLCEVMGLSLMAPEVFNCSAPDTGNMEVLLRYGTPAQRRQWLEPLLRGEIRSCFAMTEPAVASSDARNIEARISLSEDGAHYVLNGHKWWTTGSLHPKCRLCIFMGKTDPNAPPLVQQSMILVDMNSPGIRKVRPLAVYGFEEPPGGHAEIIFENVRVPRENLLVGEGHGFAIAQGRLGPGRIHHCMRLLGHSERALSLMCERVTRRVAFGKPLAAQATIQRDIAQSRLEIEQTRLLVLKAALLMDTVGNKAAATEIALIKIAAPSMAAKVVDRAIQAHGAAGLHNDLPLAAMAAACRALRLADGPDEVHLRSVARQELRRYVAAPKL